MRKQPRIAYRTQMITGADYHQLFDSLASQLHEQEGIISSEHFGSINVPGISDLDVWVFYTPPVDARSIYSVINRVQRSTSIALDVTLMPESLRSGLHFLLPDGGGQPNSQTQLPATARRDLAYAFITIWLPFKYRLLLLALMKNKPTKADLRILHSFRYTLDQFVTLNSLSSGKADAFVLKVDRLRKDYINGNDIAEDFCQTCHELFTTINQAFPAVAVARCITPKKQPPLSLTVDWCNRLTFKGNTFQAAPEGGPWIKLLPDTLKPFSLNMPANWSGILNYWYGNSRLKPHLAKIKGTLPEPESHSCWLTKQAEILAEQHVTNVQNGFKRGSMIRPLICKTSPKAAAIFRCIYQRIHK